MTQEISITHNTPIQTFHQHWKFCVGGEHAATSLRADYRDQITRIHRDLGIERLRFHGIFCDDMHTWDTVEDAFSGYSSSQGGMPAFDVPEQFAEKSFRYIGLAYDNILAAGMKPFVELSFMPKHLAKRDTQGIFWYKPNIAPPRDETQWQEYIRSFVRFLIRRYGLEEVRTWHFEVWNEPDLRIPFFDGTQEEYFRLYEITARAVKEVDHEIKVGGPATSASRWVEPFVKYCNEHDVPCDFITTHQYAGDPITDVDGSETQEESNNFDEAAQHTQDQSESAQQEQLATLFAGLRDAHGVLPLMRRAVQDNTETQDLDRSIMSKHAEMVREQAQGRPVYYTEWNACATFSAPNNDTRKIAAYDIRTALECDGKVDGSSIWCFSDIFEELHPFPEEFHGGYGLMTQHGIRKPVYYALQRLGEMGTRRFDLPGALDGEVSMAAFAGDQTVHIVATKQTLHHNARIDDAQTPYTIRIALQQAPQLVTCARIDEAHTNPLRVWQQMGSPDDITPQEVQAIEQASELVDEPIAWKYEDGELVISNALGTNDLHFITVHTVDDEYGA